MSLLPRPVARLAWVRGFVALVVMLGSGPAVRAFPTVGQQYIVKEDLGTVPGETESSAAAINSSRQITGWVGPGIGNGAFLWTPPGPMVLLEPTVELNRGVDINDEGQIAGNAFFLDFAFDSFLWTPPGPAVFLEPPIGVSFDEFALGMNNRGDVVGQWEDPPYRPFIWVAPGPAVDLGTLGGLTGYAYEVNDSRAVVGLSALADDEVSHAFFWTNDNGMRDLGALEPNGSSAAFSLNETNQIVGSVSVGTFDRAAFWAGPNAEPVELGTIDGFESRAFDISDNGVIVGESTISEDSSAMHAFRRSPGGEMRDLGTLGGQNSRANGVNDAGHVVGEAELANGTVHAVAWWTYTVGSSFKCDCSAIPSGRYLLLVLPGTRELDARRVDARLLTLGDSEGDDVPVARDPRTGALLAELRDVNGDRRADLVVRFEREVLVRAGELRPGTRHLWMQGALIDRSNGVHGTVTLGAHAR